MSCVLFMLCCMYVKSNLDIIMHVFFYCSSCWCWTKPRAIILQTAIVWSVIYTLIQGTITPMCWDTTARRIWAASHVISGFHLELGALVLSGVWIATELSGLSTRLTASISASWVWSLNKCGYSFHKSSEFKILRLACKLTFFYWNIYDWGWENLFLDL